MKLLITGGCGFLGSNLAARAIEYGYDLTVFDNLYRYGSTQNLDWLKSLGKFNFIYGDIRNRNDVENVIKQEKYDAIFHLAGQVAMTTSIDNPYLDFETNALGTFNLLNAVVMYSPKSMVLYSSTNKVYGDLEQFSYIEEGKRYTCKEHPKGFDEKIQLDFHSPYGCSKGAADQYILDFHRIYGIKTAVFRHSSMYGGRQFSTADQGWIGWFCMQAAETIKNPQHVFDISGNGKQVRDILFATDMIDLYYNAVTNIDKLAGKAYNVGGGIDNSYSLLELFDELENILKIKLNYNHLPIRKSDQKVFVADITRISKDAKWTPKYDRINGLKKMLEWLNII